MASRPVTSTIWVGNLPFEITESELGQLLGTVGPVKNLRLIVDRDTGKGKGFGFAEYYDKVTAESAFRNLNNAEVHGRNIRIDFAEDNYKNFRDRDDRPPAGDRRDGSRDNRDGGGRMIGYATAAQSAQQVAGMLGGAAANDRRMQDQLNELLASKRASELWEVLRLLRDQFGGDRQAAVNWFAERPGVAKAVFQAQVLLGMVKPPPAGPGAAAAAGPYVQQTAPANFQEGPIGLGGRMAGGPPPPPNAGPGGPPPPPGAPRPMGPGVGGPMGLPPAVPPQGPGMQVVVVDPATGQQQFIQMQQPQLGGPGMPLQQPQGMMQMPPQQQMHMTPQHQLQMQPIGQDQLVMQPIQQQQPPQQMMMQPQQPPSGGVAGALAGQDPQQTQALLRQVLAMSDEQINSLPENFKQQVLFVKEQIRIGAVKLE